MVIRQPHFLPKPKEQFASGGNSWYRNIPIGVNTLKNMMSNVCAS